MKIEDNFYSSIPHERITQKPKAKEEQNSFKTILEEIIKSSPMEEWPQKVSELAQKYDIRNATFDEFEVIALDLYYKGIISQAHCSYMMFNPTRLKAFHPIEDKYYWGTPENSEGRRDWVVEFEKRAEKDLKLGHVEGYERDLAIANVLRSISSKRETLKSSEQIKSNIVTASVGSEEKKDEIVNLAELRLRDMLIENYRQSVKIAKVLKEKELSDETTLNK